MNNRGEGGNALVGGIVAVTAAATIGVSGCSADASSNAKEYGDPVGFVVPVADAENAVWKDNYVNEGRTTAEVIEVEKGLLEDLKAQDTVEMYQTDDNWSAAVEEPMVSYDNPVIQTEEEFVKEKGCDYVRFATTNHFRPDDGIVDEFIAFMNELPEDEWLYMHCYAGEGRTTAFMVMTDIYKNYDVASFDDIAARQGLIGPVDVRT